MKCESISFDYFIKEAKRKNPLTREEEAEVGKLILRGDPDAIDKMVLHNIRFVIGEALKFSGFGCDAEDLAQEGIIGLYTAARKFDYRRGNKFISYARWDVLERMQRYACVSGRQVAFPQGTLGNMSAYEKARKSITDEMPGEPTIKEIIEASPVSESLTRSAAIIRNQPTPLDVSPYEEGGTTRLEMISGETSDPSRHSEVDSQSHSIQAILGVLTEREKLVIEMRFGLGVYEKEHTLEEVGAVLGVSRERPRQIQNGAIEKIIGSGMTGHLVDLGWEIGIDKESVEALCEKGIEEVAERRIAKCEKRCEIARVKREKRQLAWRWGES